MSPAAAGCAVPEFGLFSTSTALARANFVNTMVFSRIDVERERAERHLARPVTPLQPLAGNPAELVDALERPAAARHDVGRDARQHRRRGQRRAGDRTPLKRVRTAVYLVLTSSQYQVER